MYQEKGFGIARIHFQGFFCEIANCTRAARCALVCVCCTTPPWQIFDQDLSCVPMSWCGWHKNITMTWKGSGKRGNVDSRLSQVFHTCLQNVEQGKWNFVGARWATVNECKTGYPWRKHDLSLSAIDLCHALFMTLTALFNRSPLQPSDSSTTSTWSTGRSRSSARSRHARKCAGRDLGELKFEYWILN